MGWRFRKRLFYIFLLVFIIFLFFSPKIYRLIFYPSCFNNRLDPGEEGVDCGGPCLPCEVKGLKDLIVEKPIILIYPDETMDLIGIVRNPNKNYGLIEFKYKFILEGENGEKFEKEGISFILPPEIQPGNKYITELNLRAPDFVIKDSKLEINYEPEKWKKIEFEPIKINLLNYRIEEGNFSGEIINENFRDYSKVIINIIFKDAYGEIVGLGKTTLYDFKSTEKRAIFLPEVSKFLGEPKEVFIYPEINLFEE